MIARACKVYTSATIMDNTSKILKCSNCNIVICEVLAFVQNKLDVMDEQSIVQICESAFSVDEIDIAKSLLFESVSKRPSIRKRKGKTLRNIEDIICLLKETDPEQVPIFVARRLEKLPPVTFDHVDVTPLLKKMLILEKSIQNIQSDYVTKSDLNDQLIGYCKITSVHQQNNVNTKRGGGSNYCDNGVDDSLFHMPCNGSSQLLHSSNPSSAVVMSVSEKEQAPPACSRELAIESASETTRERPVHCNTDNKMQPISATINKSAVRPPNQAFNIDNIRSASFSEIAQKEGEWKEPKKSEEWILYQKRRLRNRFISQKGCATDSKQMDQKFKAADIRVPLFISNVDKNVSEQDIISYVFEKTNETVSLMKINMKRQKDYNAFKVFVTKHKIDIFLDDKLWPTGISFRRFVNFYERRINKKNIDISATNN